jgi:hypothetical protein
MLAKMIIQTSSSFRMFPQKCFPLPQSSRRHLMAHQGRFKGWLTIKRCEGSEPSQRLIVKVHKSRGGDPALVKRRVFCCLVGTLTAIAWSQPPPAGTSVRAAFAPYPQRRQPANQTPSKGGDYPRPYGSTDWRVRALQRVCQRKTIMQMPASRRGLLNAIKLSVIQLSRRSNRQPCKPLEMC